MRISMCMIVRDCANEIAETLGSFWDDVDEVVVVDTGSTDATIKIARKYAEARGDLWTAAAPAGEAHAENKLKIGHFDWCDDFAAARNYADGLATGDWLSWADHDDFVVGMPNLRRLAEEADPDVNSLFVAYDYAVHDGQVICELYRERLVRRGKGTWVDRVHESQMVPGKAVKVDRDLARWVHRKPPFEQSDRNTLILEKWVEEEPGNPRVLASLARDHMSAGRFEPAVPYYERYLRVAGQPAETRAQATRQLAMALFQMGRFEWAHEQTLRSFGECPTWPDTYLTFAEVAAMRGDWGQVIHHSETVLRLGPPSTLLIVNPQDYTVKPRALIAQALAEIGNVEEACRIAEEALELAPGYQTLPDMLAEWQSTRQRDQTAGMWSQCAQLLVNYDEPLKAAELLKTVPHYAWDHHLVVAARVAVRDAVDEPYVVEPVEDGPRAEFLLKGLREQAGTLQEIAA